MLLHFDCGIRGGAAHLIDSLTVMLLFRGRTQLQTRRRLCRTRNAAVVFGTTKCLPPRIVNMLMAMMTVFCLPAPPPYPFLMLMLNKRPPHQYPHCHDHDNRHNRHANHANAYLDCHADLKRACFASANFIPDAASQRVQLADLLCSLPP